MRDQEEHRQGGRRPNFLRLGVAGLGIAVVIAIFAAGVAWNMGLPGLYMDAVNPDYLVVRMLADAPWRLPAWVLPGNLLGDRWPVLTSLYHGTLHAWTLLPLYAAFGSSLELLRASHALWGVAILLGLWTCLRRNGGGPWISIAVPLLLAIDPAFIFAFRTQLYITLAPMLFTLLAMQSAQREKDARTRGQHFSAALLTGLFSGLAIYGYFVYAFFLPGMIAWLGLQYFANRAPDRGAGVPCIAAGLALGLALGALGYLVGYGLILHEEGGWAGLLAYLHARSAELKAFQASYSFFEVTSFFIRVLRDVVSGQWQAQLMLGEHVPFFGQYLKPALMFAVTGIGSMMLTWRGKGSMWLCGVWLLMLSFGLGALCFGERLSGHHFAPFIVLAYMAAAFTVVGISELAPRAAPWFAGLALLSAGISLAGQTAIQQRLVATGGRLLYSEAIMQFSNDAARLHSNALYVLPDWGLFMPLQLLTGGRVDHVLSIDDSAQQVLCSGRDLVVALIGADAPQRLEEQQRRFGWKEMRVQQYLDREKNLVISAGLVTPADARDRCAALAEARAEAAKANALAEKRGVRVVPPLVGSCRAQAVTLTWDFLDLPAGANVEVKVKQRDAAAFQLFKVGSAADGAETGPWVKVGTQFRFADPRSGDVLATMTMLPDERGCQAAGTR